VSVASVRPSASRADLHHREHRLPELGLVAEHDDDAVVPAYALLAQPAGHLGGPLRELGERQLPPARSGSTIHNAVLALSCAITSSQSSAQLKC
jgi:hypothetical protein